MKTCILIMLAIICLAAAGDAAELPPEAAPDAQDVTEDIDPSPAVSLTTLSEEQAAHLSPLHSGMRTILLREQADVQALTARMADIQDRIAEVKTGTEVSLLKVQADTARASGREQDAERLEESIRLLRDPQRGAAPAGSAARRGY